MVSDAVALDRALDRIAVQVARDHPIIASLEAHEHEALIGLGAELSFVQLSAASGAGTYLITSASAAAPGVVEFWLHGAHHTEIPCRYLVAPSLARGAVRDFMASGAPPSAVEWVEVGA